MTDPTFLSRVVLENYKSIAWCDVRLRQLTFLIGPNGSGKSSFLDALRFVADALRTSLDHAIRDRGGFAGVSRRSATRPRPFGLRLEFRLPSGEKGHYAFRIRGRPRGSYEVEREECVVYEIDSASAPPAAFTVVDGSVVTGLPAAAAAFTDRLYLVAASGQHQFRPLYDALSHMGFYNLNPDRMRDLQPPDAGDLLARDGANIASVVGRIEAADKSTKRRLETYLAAIVPGIQSVGTRSVGSRETLEFFQRTAETAGTHVNNHEL
ncbi:MAG: AAA family ATPase [Chloroflexi bacterium]|nr:AAA family ATPase [Chloroflexota bacterium]